MIGRRNFLRSLAATALVGLGMRLPKAVESALDMRPETFPFANLDPLSRMYFNLMIEDSRRSLTYAMLGVRDTGPEAILEIENGIDRPHGGRTIRIKRWNPTDTPLTQPDLPHEIGKS